MKRLTIILCSGLTGPTAPVHAAPAKLENIKQIVCESTVSYDEDTPNEKKPTHGVETFTPGSRKDVKPRPGAFLLAESENADGSGQEVFDNQQFYFSPIKNGNLSLPLHRRLESPRRTKAPARRYGHRVYQPENSHHRAEVHDPHQLEGRRYLRLFAPQTFPLLP